ncbi:MAG: S8 family serine peptidase [Candidatus Thorarchaeota archaeon]
MRYSLVLVLLLLFVAVPAAPIADDGKVTDNCVTGLSHETLNLPALAERFGDSIPVVVTFNRPMDSALATLVESCGAEFSFGGPSASHVHDYYVLRGSADALQTLTRLGVVRDMRVQTPAQYLEATRDVSIPEIDADVAWNMLDSLGRNLTGKGLVIADLDSGVDWRHPDLWFAGDTEYSWIDVLPDAMPGNGSDAIDIDGDLTADSKESFFWIDIDDDVTFNASTDWIWVDNVTNDAVPQPGEPFFVVNDTNHNDALDVGEKLVMLVRPKTRFIVETDGSAQRNIVVWQRGVNLTASTHKDTDGHGTAVSGILLGGQLGYRKYVGVAPDAELMMLNVLSGNTWLYVDEALTWAYNHGADVILTELGSWTYQYLDGSTAAETLINTIVADGIPVISPSGNLGGKDKHALSSVAANSPYQIDFTIPNPDGTYVTYPIENVYITVLSVNSTNFSQCNFSVIMDMAVWGGPRLTIYLHPGSGYQNFNAEPAKGWGGNMFIVESFISTSSRGTRMLGIWIHGALPTTAAPPWHQVNITAPAATVFHSYISDDQSSWTGGCVWKSDISNAYEITWPSTADEALSVASYRTRVLPTMPSGTVGDIASFSSRGPRIDEVLKQGIAAPGGYDIVSDYSNASTWQNWFNAIGQMPFNKSFGGYRMFSGTSASGPHVAGCAALMLQYDSSIGSSVAQKIKDSATRDSFTGDEPNAVWGHGKLNVSAAILQSDSTPPVIHSVVRSPDSVEYYDTVSFEVNVSDNMDVYGAYVKYDVGEWTSPMFSALSLTASGNYTGSIGPFSYGDTVYYSIYANDSAGQDAETAVSHFSVSDSVEPWLGNFWRNATTPGGGHAVKVRVDVVEPSGAAGVQSVILNWSADSGPWNTVTMSGAGNTYSAVIPAQLAGTSVQYYFIATDNAGNTNTSAVFSYTTVTAETNPPTVDNLTHSPANPTSADTVTITVDATDESGISEVVLRYYNGTHWVNVTMTLVGDHYEATIPALPAGTNVTYYVVAYDMQGNHAISDTQYYVVSESTTTTTTSTTATSTTTTETTTTTGTTTTTTTSSTTSTTLPTQPDPLLLAAMLGIIIALVLLPVFWSRRRSQ